MRPTTLSASLLAVVLLNPAMAWASRTVEVCFALDTTGSMSGLITAAKDKIWYIANQIVNAPNKPQVRFCLMGYRDRGDEYVTRHLDLSDDMDRVYDELMGFEANGGGDHREAVNQALLETVRDSSWSDSPDVLKLIFLVGDAPPHTDYNEPQYTEIANMARRRGIIINPVLCGHDDEAKRIWQSIADSADGEKVVLRDPAGATRTVSTPLDQDLAVLGPRLDATVIPYGPSQSNATWERQSERNRELKETVAADRLAFKATTGTLVTEVDLITALERGEVTLDTLNPHWLHPAVRSMNREELARHLSTVRAERADLTRVIAALVSERQSVLEAKRSQTGFDAEVSRVILTQIRHHLADPDTRP